MILASKAQRTAFLDAYQDRVSGVSPQAQALANTVNNERFPGALVAVGGNTEPVYLVLADSRLQWRRLAPLVQAFVAPPISAFRPIPDTLRENDPRERWIKQFDVQVVGRIVPRNRAHTLTGLIRLVELSEQIPDSVAVTARSTSSLLLEFDRSLAGRDERSAQDVLNVIQDERRLDTLNVRFLQVQFDASLGQWARLRSRSWFDDLVQVRRPPPVTLALLDALADSAPQKPDELRAWFTTEVAPRYLEVFAHVPAGMSAHAGVLFGLAWIVRPDWKNWPALEAEANRWQPADRDWFDTIVGSAGLRLIIETGDEDRRSDDTESSAGETDQISLAIAALIQADRDTSLEAFRRATDAIHALTDAERAQVLEHEQFAETWDLIRDLTGEFTPRSWTQLIRGLAQLSPSRAREVAERGKVEWSTDVLELAEEVDGLTRELSGISRETEQGLEAILGQLVDWFQSDIGWPRLACSSMYNAVLYRLLLSERLSGGTFSAVVAVADGILTYEMDAAHYRQILDDLVSSLDRLSDYDLDSVLDLFEIVLSRPCSDPIARSMLADAIVRRLAQWRQNLRGWRRFLAIDLAQSAGVSVDLLQRRDETANADQVDRLAGKVIVVYSLQSNAGRRARDAIAAMAPQADVRFLDDRAGSKHFSDGVRTADIVIISWKAANHAATEALERACPATCTKLHAAGKGSTSILRSVEDYVEAV